MPPRKSSTPESDEIVELREEIADLRQHMRVLIDVMDGIREELSWLSRNGFPREDPLAPIPVLKQMAADPCDPRWGEKLVIARGDDPARCAPAERDNESPVTSPRPNLAEFFEGDAVEFIHEGRDVFGEIVTIDDGRNEATVMLIPGDEEVVMSLDRLELVPPDEEDDDAAEAKTPAAASVEHPSRGSDQEPSASQGLPPPGQLFSDPGAQKRLF